MCLPVGPVLSCGSCGSGCGLSCSQPSGCCPGGRPRRRGGPGPGWWNRPGRAGIAVFQGANHPHIQGQDARQQQNQSCRHGEDAGCPRPSRQCRWATMSAPHSERQRASLRTQRTSLAWIRRRTSGSTGASLRMRKEEGRKLGGGSRGTSRRMRPAEGSYARMPHFAASVSHCYDRDQLKPFGFPSCHRQ